MLLIHIKRVLFFCFFSLLIFASPVQAALVSSSLTATTNEDSQTSIILRATGATRISYSLVSQTQNGSITLVSNSVTYTPNANFNGTDSFTYRARDGRGRYSNTATVTITVNAVNDTPTVADLDYSTKMSQDVTITLAGSDIDGDSLSYSVTESPSHGNITMGSNGEATYTPAAGYLGDDRFSYQVSDGVSDSVAAVVTLKVNPNKGGAIAVSKIKDFLVNKLIGLEASGNNALKLQDACMAEDGSIVAVGIMTNTVSIYREGELHIIPTPLESDFHYKRVYCGQSRAIVVTETQVLRVELPSLAATLIRDFSGEGENVYYLAAHYSETAGRIIIQFLGSQRALVLDDETLATLAEWSLSRSDFYTLADGDILAVDTSGNKLVSRFDGQSLSLESSFTLANVGSITATAYNPDTNELWWFNNGRQTANYVSLNTSTGIQKSVSGMIPSLTQIAFAKDKIIVMCENCYDTGEDGNQSGGITVVDANTKQKLYDLPVLHEHHRLMIDPVTGLAVMPNNEIMSVTLADPDSGATEIIDMGNGYEWLETDASGMVYLLNRVGGNSLTSLNPFTEENTTIDTEYWPIGLATTADKKNLYTWNHLANGFSTYEITSVVGAPSVSMIDFVDCHAVVTEPENDALGDVVYDSTRGIFYATVPEYNTLIVGNAGTCTAYPLPDYLGGAGYEDLKGPGKVTLALDEVNNRLFAHAKDVSTTYILDAANGFGLIGTLAVNAGGAVYPLKVVGDKLYAGREIYNLVDFSRTGRIPYGDFIVDQDTENGVIITQGTASQREMLYVIDLETSSLLGEYDLGPVTVAAPKLKYDPYSGLVYALYLAEARLSQIKIFE